jgi:hypothetical protein
VKISIQCTGVSIVSSTSFSAKRPRRRLRLSSQAANGAGETPRWRHPILWAVAAWRSYERLTQRGLPRRFPLIQIPNAPLIIAFVAGQVGTYLHGLNHDYASAVSYLAMTIWAYEELVHGVNWFRHLLGFGYVILIAMRVAAALNA